jgi:hypothetical protein
LSGHKAPGFPGAAVFLGILLCCGLSSPAYGKGKKEEVPEKEPLNKDWVLCVTAFDTSSLSPENRIIGEVMARTLTDSLNSVDQRIRVSPEYAYYEEYAWSKARTEAAGQLAAKQAERDLLLYQGGPAWKYRRDLKAVDKEIEKLKILYRETEAEIPAIVTEPEFRLTDGNNSGVFPALPEPGMEYRFCAEQNADAFLAGAVSEYHGRIFISLKMYTLYTRSFHYEDSAIFSPEDITPAVTELAGRLGAAVSGTRPAAVAVKAAPPEAVVLIDEAFAGRGETAVLDHRPGTAEVRVFADNHETVSVSADLIAGELAELYIDLKPLALAALTVTVSGVFDARVYRGSLYIGNAPITLSMPLDRHEYFYVQTPGGETAAMVYRGIDGTAVLEPETPREKEVEWYRRKFYGAYGRFWIALPAAFLLSGIAGTYTSAYNSGGNPDIYDKTVNYYYISIAAMAVSGFLLAESFFRLYHYVNNSGEDAPVLWNK